MGSIPVKSATGVALVLLAAVALLMPTIIAHFRQIRDFASVSAFNALTLLMVVCIPTAPAFVWGVGAVWLVSTIWAIAGRRRDA